MLSLRGDWLLQPGVQVILLDNHLPGASGIAALPGLKEAAPLARVLIGGSTEKARRRISR